VEAIWPLLNEQIADLQPSGSVDPALGWDATEGRIAASTVRVMFVEKRVKPKPE
jgi:hypothetical protein